MRRRLPLWLLPGPCTERRIQYQRSHEGEGLLLSRDHMRAVAAASLRKHTGDVLPMDRNGAKGGITVGDVRLCKETVGEIRQRVGVVFQNPDDQLFMPTIYDDVAFGLRNYGIAEADIERRVDRQLRELRMAHLKHKSSLKQSAGEKRTVAIATVLVMEPTVMLFDEPTAFLDPKARRNLINLLGKLPHTKLIATHDISFAAQVCDRAILLKSGRIFADGASVELLFDEKTMDDCGVEAIA